jgi:adenylosuccinate lyase
MHAWQEGKNFRDLVLADRAVTGRVPRKQVEHAFDLKRQLRNVDKIFARVFPGKPGKALNHKERKGTAKGAK